MAAKKKTVTRQAVESMIKDMRMRHDEELRDADMAHQFEHNFDAETHRVAAGIYNDVAGRVECILAQMGQEGF